MNSKNISDFSCGSDLLPFVLRLFLYIECLETLCGWEGPRLVKLSRFAGQAFLLNLQLAICIFRHGDQVIPVPLRFRVGLQEFSDVIKICKLAEHGTLEVC